MTHCVRAHDLFLHPSRPLAARRAFSLIEVLLAIFILGIGVISIAALFPAGIAQQRLSSDDLMGPIVANHAMSVIRSKVKPEDFGRVEEFANLVFAGTASDHYRSPTIHGDWGWMRPALLLQDEPPPNATPRFNEHGAIDIFSWRRVMAVRNMMPPLNLASELFDGWPRDAFPDLKPWFPRIPSYSGIPVLYGIPFDLTGYQGPFDPPIPPRVIITQGERFYPMQLEDTTVSPPRLRQRPQYVWECMFRRLEGRIYVAVFVYRVASPDSASEYRTPGLPGQAPQIPFQRVNPVPWRAGAGAPDTQVRLPDGTLRQGEWITGSPNNDYDPRDPTMAWQESRQWLLDQNGLVHRVISNSPRTQGNQTVRAIELSQGVQPIIGWGNTVDLEINELRVYPNTFVDVGVSMTPSWYSSRPAPPPSSSAYPGIPQHVYDGLVTDIWYMPREIETPAGSFRITPVYIAVKEL